MTEPRWNDAPPPGNGSRVGRLDNGKNTSPPLPPAHHNAPPGTSDAAARWIAPYTGPMRERVYAFIRDRGPLGATDDEGEATLGMKPQSYTPRRGELAKAGRIVMTGDKRPTASGCKAAVWIASEHAEPSTDPTEGGDA